MPIYEYRCQTCETKFEQLIRDGDALVLKCPKCGADEVNRLLSVFATSNTVSRSFVSSAEPSAGGGGHCCGGGGCGCH